MYLVLRIWQDDESGVLFTGGGMLLGVGDDNVAIGNTVVYAGVGDTSGKGGFIWEANNEGIWVFENNLAHSNHIGIRVWQNTVTKPYSLSIKIVIIMFATCFMVLTVMLILIGVVIFMMEKIEIKASSANTSGVRFESVKFHASW